MKLQIDCRRAGALATGLLSCLTACAQIPPDAFLYYQRTHNGQLPPPNALSLGTDGFIIDTEAGYETNVSRLANARAFGPAIKTNYPNRFLAHAPLPYLNSQSGFPYVQFGVYRDVGMPQDYNTQGMYRARLAP